MEKGTRPLDGQEEEEVSPQLREALADYFEYKNGDERAGNPVAFVDAAHQAEWEEVVALLQVPQRMATLGSDVDGAWNAFRSRAFGPQAALQTAGSNQESLGGYVAEALSHNEQNALRESGLPKNTLEALKADGTPLQDLKGYALNDYVALARRYGVKDSAFPRMLKWLKGLGKNLLAPSPGPARGMLFARDDEPRQPGLSEAELANEVMTDAKTPNPEEEQ